MANALMLLSLAGDVDDHRVFECKACNRKFSSFQALGGHMASHKKPRLPEINQESKAKVHGCSICGLEFATGQALGGHMRRHRAAASNDGFGNKKYGFVEMKKSINSSCNINGKRVNLLLDLNLPPVDDDDGEMMMMECRKLGIEKEGKLMYTS